MWVPPGMEGVWVPQGYQGLLLAARPSRSGSDPSAVGIRPCFCCRGEPAGLAKTPLLSLTLWRVNKLNPTFIQCCLLRANNSDFEVWWVRAVLGTLRKDKAPSTGSVEQGTFQTHEQQLYSQPALPAVQYSTSIQNWSPGLVRCKSVRMGLMQMEM